MRLTLPENLYTQQVYHERESASTQCHADPSTDIALLKGYLAIFSDSQFDASLQYSALMCACALHMSMMERNAWCCDQVFDTCNVIPAVVIALTWPFLHHHVDENDVHLIDHVVSIAKMLLTQAQASTPEYSKQFAEQDDVYGLSTTLAYINSPKYKEVCK